MYKKLIQLQVDRMSMDSEDVQTLIQVCFIPGLLAHYYVNLPLSKSQTNKDQIRARKRILKKCKGKSAIWFQTHPHVVRKMEIKKN